MVSRIATAAVVLIVALAGAAAVFRIYTAPDRIEKRMKLAKETCMKAGGAWTLEGREPICKRS